jgi:hypothetical protein
LGLIFEILQWQGKTAVSSLSPVVARSVNWGGLEWKPACLAFHERRRPVRTASVTQVRQAVYTRSGARWKHYQKDLGAVFEQL